MHDPPPNTPGDNDVECGGAHLKRQSQAGLRSALVQGGIILVSVTATALIVRVLLGGRPPQSSWTVQILLAVATVMGIFWGAWQRYKMWTLPVRQLKVIVEKVRRGNLPLDEISRVKGVPGVLVPVIRDLLLDLRGQKQAMQQLEREMQQRVASRTDALERALGSLREKASRDPMTGLFNRRMLDETLPQMVSQCIADGRSLAVLMIDVDYFKLLNDTLGHSAGDDLLRSIGQIIRSTARGSDFAFRSGGDEFVVLMPDADHDASQALNERLVSLVDALAKTLRVERRPRLSIGMAHLRDAKLPTAQSLMDLADKALYLVKGTRKRTTQGSSAVATSDLR